MAVPSVLEDRLVFTLDDADRRWTRVALDCDDAVLGRRRFRRTAQGWGLVLPRPKLNRVEYRLVVTEAGGTTEVICDPDNPERVDTAFGERSVALMPGYERPGWLRQDVSPGSAYDVAADAGPLGQLPVSVWSPAGLDADMPAPLLVAHDGPAYVGLASLTHYAAAMCADETLPPFRIALMTPVDRDEWYAANPEYVAAELAAIDRIAESVPVQGQLVTMGASLGALTAMLAAQAGEGRFGGVVAQSGSFFTPHHDEQESTYPYFARVTAAVAAIAEEHATEQPLVIGMTCGALEENLANNEAMATDLRRQGHRVTLRRVADLHNFTAWRDSLHPTLTEVLRSVWEPRG